MKKKNKLTAVFVGSTLVLGSALVGSAPAFAASGATALGDVAPELARPQTPADLPPAAVDLQRLGGIKADTVRSVGHDDVADYWIGQSSATDICLITAVRGGNEVAGSSCRSLAEFNRFGLAMITGEDVGRSDRAAEAYYLPADISTSSISAAPSTRITSLNTRGLPATDENLAAGRPEKLSLHAREIARGDGSTFHFEPLAMPSDNNG